MHRQLYIRDKIDQVYNKLLVMTKEYLLWLKVTDDCVDAIKYFLNEWHHLANLNLNEMPATFLRDFNKSVTRHVLNTIMCF